MSAILTFLGRDKMTDILQITFLNNVWPEKALV